MEKLYFFVQFHVVGSEGVGLSLEDRDRGAMLTTLLKEGGREGRKGRKGGINSGRTAEGLVLGPITTPSTVMYIGQLIVSHLAFVM